MNATLLIAALVLSGSADSLSAVKVAGLSLKAPTAWKSTDADDGKSWEEPTGASQIELSVFKVDPKRGAQECLDQLIEKLGKDGWEKQVVNNQPAVRKITTDYVGEADAGKTEANKVSTVMVVGCNGSTKWVMSMTSKSAKAARFGPLLKTILSTMSYEK